MSDMQRDFKVPWGTSVQFLQRLLSNTSLSNRGLLTIYGCLRDSVPSGRPNDFSVVSREEMLRMFDYGKANGIRTMYLLNGLTQESSQWRNEHLDWVVNDLQPERVCVAEYNLALKLSKEYKVRNLWVSTIAGWKSIREAQVYLHDPDLATSIIGVCLHHDITTENHKSARSLCGWLKKQGIETDVLVTESCVPYCHLREEHYRLFGEKARQLLADEYADCYQVNCILNRLLHPWTLLDISGFLLPSMLDEFSEETGVSGFKISGRSKPDDWIVDTYMAYNSGLDPENIYDIIVFTVPGLYRWNLDSSDLFYVHRDAYLNSVQQLRDMKSPFDRNVMLRELAAKYFENGMLRINDPGSRYEVINGQLLVTKRGEYAECLLGRERTI